MAGNQLTRDLWDHVRTARLVRVAQEYSTLLPDYFAAAPRAGCGDSLFEDIHTYVMFLGVGRSGTTLVGALLDAHPNAVIANEQNTLKYLYPFPFPRERIFRLLLRNSAFQAARGRPGGGGYRYAVAGQFQGRFKKIGVIGDKSRSAQAVEWLVSRPSLLERLGKVTRARVKLLHVIRNPLDTIARRSLRRNVSVEKIGREYLVLTALLETLLQRIEAMQEPVAEQVTLHLENLIGDPVPVLTTLCEALGIHPTPAYLEACSGILYREPARARDLVSWPPWLLEEIQRKTEQVPWLRRYSFEDE